ncbi:hypothetical protein CR983_00760 [Candidatus Saccharibacteria bacterium]|nr:MAG: hypothetical protein CR983_00760 [Candidatus Saccharibacteria bacterium]
MVERKSFIVTGASASGKTTLVRLAKEIGYEYLPGHTSREKRPDEIEGIDGVFVTRSLFEKNFRDGKYLEPSLEYAELKSISTYYGTPSEWIHLLNGPNRCASPAALKMARKVFQLSNAAWIHLICNDTDRIERLIARGYPQTEIDARMNSGDFAREIPREAKVYNTSTLTPNELLQVIDEGAID